MSVKEFFLDLLFPIECLGCGQEKIWLCPDCLDQIPLNNNFHCPFCQKHTQIGETCPDCRASANLDGLLVAGDYKHEVLKQAIRCFKYNYAVKLADDLGKFTEKFLTKIKQSGFFILPSILIDQQNGLIAPVPLSKRRLRQRGFNQAELLAQKVADHLNFNLANLLEKKINNEPQAHLSGKDRYCNVKDIFTCPEKNSAKDKKIILIDDVATTGSTLEEAARVLKQAGAKEVWGLVLARG